MKWDVFGFGLIITVIGCLLITFVTIPSFQNVNDGVEQASNAGNDMGKIVGGAGKAIFSGIILYVTTALFVFITLVGLVVTFVYGTDSKRRS